MTVQMPEQDIFDKALAINWQEKGDIYSRG